MGRRINEPADQGWDDMTVFGMVIVARPVKIGRHDATIVNAFGSAILPIIALAQFDPCDFRNRIGFVGRLQRARQQRILPHRLRRKLWVDAARSEEQQPTHTGAERLMNDISLDH